MGEIYPGLVFLWQKKTALVFPDEFSSSEHCMNVFICFNLLLVCAWHSAKLKRLIGYKFERKNISLKGSTTENMVGLIFKRNKNRYKYSINQDVDGFKTCQQWTLWQSFYFINFGLVCACNMTLLAISLGYNFQRKNSSKGSSYEIIGIFDFHKE